jgi:hypothetical protein
MIGSTNWESDFQNMNLLGIIHIQTITKWKGNEAF